MVFDPACHAAIVSFLQEAQPFYTPLHTITTDPNVRQRYSSCLMLTMRCLCRLLVARESPIAWIAPEHHAKLVYANFLVTVPVCFDALLACGRSNRALLSRLIGRVLAIDRRYQGDLRGALVHLKQQLLAMQERIDDAGANATDAERADLAAYALDCAATAAVLLDCSPEAVRAAGEVQLEQTLTSFYDQALPVLYRQIYEVDPDAAALAFLQQCRAEILRAFRAIVDESLVKVYADPSECILPVEYVLAVLQEALSDPVFVVDYKRSYPVDQDFDVLVQACPELDMVKVQFLRNAYTATSDEHFLTTSTYPPPEPISTQIKRNKPATVNINAPLIQSVLDVLPDLNGGFVARLLERYANNTEQVIAAVLEGNLPPDLQPNADDVDAESSSASVEKPYKKTSVAPKQSKPTDPFGFGDAPGVIVKRNKGFPGQARSLAALLDDKTHVRQLRDRYHEWGLVAETTPDDRDGSGATGTAGQYNNDYDDEYDDSYDAMAETERRGGANGGGASRRATAVRNPNRAVFDELRDEIEDDDEDEDDEDEEDTEGATGSQPQAAAAAGRGASGGATSSYYDRSRNFCENPEVVRERRAQAWSNKWGAARQPQQQPKKPAGGDVVGKPKGHGQDASTQRSRAKKETHKSEKANHNRRQGASWKRNTGMIPS